MNYYNSYHQPPHHPHHHHHRAHHDRHPHQRPQTIPDYDRADYNEPYHHHNSNDHDNDNKEGDDSPSDMNFHPNNNYEQYYHPYSYYYHPVYYPYFYGHYPPAPGSYDTEGPPCYGRYPPPSHSHSQHSHTQQQSHQPPYLPHLPPPHHRPHYHNHNNHENGRYGEEERSPTSSSSSGKKKSPKDKKRNYENHHQKDDDNDRVSPKGVQQLDEHGLGETVNPTKKPKVVSSPEQKTSNGHHEHHLPTKQQQHPPKLPEGPKVYVDEDGREFPLHPPLQHLVPLQDKAQWMEKAQAAIRKCHGSGALLLYLSDQRQLAQGGQMPDMTDYMSIGFCEGDFTGHAVTYDAKTAELAVSNNCGAGGNQCEIYRLGLDEASQATIYLMKGLFPANDYEDEDDEEEASDDDSQATISDDEELLGNGNKSTNKKKKKDDDNNKKHSLPCPPTYLRIYPFDALQIFEETPDDVWPDYNEKIHIHRDIGVLELPTTSASNVKKTLTGIIHDLVRNYPKETK